MIMALRAWRGLAMRAAIPAVAVGAAITLAGSAAQAAPAAHHRQNTGRVLPVLFSGLKVYASPVTGSAADGRLGSAGSLVSVACWTTGTVYVNSPIWYQISAPLSGYLPAFNVAAHFAPAIGVAHCPVPQFRRQYNSIESGLRIRAQASTNGQVVANLPAIADQVTVDCYVTGTAIFGDPIWYHTVAPSTGYVTGRFLNTGGDPDLGVPPC